MKSLILAVLAVAVSSVAYIAPAAGQPVSPSKLEKSQAGFMRLKVGTINVIALSDGTISFPFLEVLTNVKRDRAEKLLADSYLKTPLDASVNAYLIPIGNRVILVDAGAGELYGPMLNKLTASIKTAGYTPEQVTDILLTHIHTDHSGGLMDGDRPVFPNATIHVEKQEIDYWLTPANMTKAPESHKKRFLEAEAKVRPYLKSGNTKTFEGETQLFPEIRAIPAPGHTPGHTFYALESDGERMIFWGDILHVAELQFVDPSITVDFDVDSRFAALQRKKAFADAAKNRYLVAPAHTSFPGVGHVRANGGRYEWVPIPYVNDAVRAGR